MAGSIGLSRPTGKLTMPVTKRKSESVPSAFAGCLVQVARHAGPPFLGGRHEVQALQAAISL